MILIRRKRSILLSLILLALLVGVSAWWTWREIRQARLDVGLLEAIKRNDPHEVKFWLDAGANPNYRYATCETTFECMSARLHGRNPTRPILLPEVYHGHTAIVVCLLAKGANVQVKDEDGSTALMWAAQQGYTDLVKLLLAHGIPIEAKDEDGNTALMRSLWSGDPATVEVLLRAGANARARNRRGETPLSFARQNPVMVRLLQAVLKQANAKK